jgi:hypothetical protein
MIALTAALVPGPLLRQHAPAFCEGRKMKKSPFHPGPLEALTAQELEALSALKRGSEVATPMVVRLEMLDLAQENLRGWALTPEGDWRLGQGR